ncbi:MULTISPECIES: ABC transporter ATP-binding protein [Actinomycetaceae]|uniref:ABC transporter ATP-binding protein n=1 Tax=Actinomycetaceae TaxID=2049 RepID=UPI0008A1FCE6|nr:MULTISPECIES: ABC transporter ATP-binding protein [Actinomycetaceae]MBS6100998.1 ABC transporter ATP-binding protein [Actinomyces sp.]MDK7143315.1 ABC transporter ATP-binding protein [Gleimia europaea]MDU5568517.1 ABC transporter ATP-binding protein [Actinomyces sp.]OFJ62738.1 ABC transporter ATP-binding protein [Actinomyces sp. HMSC075B09]
MFSTFKDFTALMKRLRECVPLFVSSTIVTALAQISVVGVSVTSVWVSTRFILDPAHDLTPLVTLLFTLVVVHAASTLFEVWWSHEVAYRILHTLRVHIYGAIERIAPLGLHGKRTGDVASAAMNDAEQLEWFYAHTASTAICAVFSPVVFTGVLVSFVGPLGLIMLVPTIAMIVFPFILMPIQRMQGTQMRSQLAGLRVAVLDSIQGQRELRSLGMVEKQNQLILDLTRQVQATKNAQTMRQAWESAFAMIVTTIGSTILLIILTGRVLDGSLDAAILPVAVVLAGLVPTPATTLVGMLGRVGEIGACAHRINTILHVKDPIPAVPEPHHTAYDGEENCLVVDNAVFAYQLELPVINKVSLTATPQRSVAIVGKSGAGKTTLANLAMRYLDPRSGQLRFDGKNLRGYEPNRYRDRLALVPQDCHIFAGTVRDNLILANPNASDEDIWRALADADISELVTSLGGLDARVGDRGTTLSGGERQRVGIARAFLRNPDMLILDEPLANIDPFLETSIAKNIRRARADRTTVVIAHRLASIRIADHIIVLEDGRIVADGAHEQLKNNPTYASLLGSQIN